MMEILTKTELQLRYQEILEKIANGAVFIYPTDTIYGIGCNALDKKAVAKIRKIKERVNNPFSVWVPSEDWIKENCTVSKEAKEHLKQLPGPTTLIMKLKKKDALAENVIPKIKTVGVRIPNHWFGQIVKQLNFPIVTTSANKAGHPFMTSIENLHPDVKTGIDFMIYEGPKEGRPSKIINLVAKKVKER